MLTLGANFTHSQAQFLCLKKMDEQLRGENMLSAVCAKASCSLSSWGLDLAARDFVNEVDV